VNKFKSPIGVIFLFFLIPSTVSAGGSLSATRTQMRFSDTDFILNGNLLRFDSGNVEGAQLDFRYQFNNGLSVGASLNVSDWDIDYDQASSYGGDANVYQRLAVGQMNFLPKRVVQPLIGVSIGQMEVSVHSATSVRLTGITRSFYGGFEVRPRRKLGLEFKYQRSYADLDDVSGNEMKTNYAMLSASVKVYFSSRVKNNDSWNPVLD